MLILHLLNHRPTYQHHLLILCSFKSFIENTRLEYIKQSDQFSQRVHHIPKAIYNIEAVGLNFFYFSWSKLQENSIWQLLVLQLMTSVFVSLILKVYLTTHQLYAFQNQFQCYMKVDFKYYQGLVLFLCAWILLCEFFVLHSICLHYRNDSFKHIVLCISMCHQCQATIFLFLVGIISSTHEQIDLNIITIIHVLLHNLLINAKLKSFKRSSFEKEQFSHAALLHG